MAGLMMMDNFYPVAKTLRKATGSIFIGWAKQYNYCWLISGWLDDWLTGGTNQEEPVAFIFSEGPQKRSEWTPGDLCIVSRASQYDLGCPCVVTRALMNTCITLWMFEGSMRHFNRVLAVLGALPGVLVMWFILKKIKLIMLDLISTWLEHGSVKLCSIIMW